MVSYFFFFQGSMRKEDDDDSKIQLQRPSPLHLRESRPPHWNSNQLFFFSYSFVVTGWLVSFFNWNSSICHSTWPTWRDGPTIFMLLKLLAIVSWAIVRLSSFWCEFFWGFICFSLESTKHPVILSWIFAMFCSFGALLLDWIYVKLMQLNFFLYLFAQSVFVLNVSV